MIEALAYLINNIDLFGLGNTLPLLFFTIAISLALSNGNKERFLTNLLITNYAMAVIIYVGTDQALYFLVAATITIIILLLPEGSLNNIVGRPKEVDK